jgi:hypothetical protein
MSREAFFAISRTCYAAALLTLPLVGVGVVRLLTGLDSGAGFQPAYLCLALAWLTLLVAWGPYRFWNQIQSVASWNRFWLIALAAVLLSGLGLWLRPAEAPGSLRFLRFVKQIVQLFVMYCFMISPAIWSQGSRNWSTLVRILSIALVFELVYSLVQGVNFYRPLAMYAVVDGWFTSNPAILSGSEELFLGESFSGIPRLRGTMCEPLYLGNYLLMVLPILVFAWRGRRWLWLLPAAGGILLLLTWARGAYFGACIAVLVAVILLIRSGHQPSWRQWIMRLVPVTAVVAVAVIAVGGSDSLLLPWQRVLQSFHSGDWSNLTRLYSMQAGWRAFCASPLVGVGWGQFGYHFPLLVDPLGLQSQFAWPVVNNFPLQILCETGLVGFAVFMLATIWLVRRVWSAVSPDTDAGRQLGQEGRLRVVALATATAGVWSQLLTFSQYNLPHIWVSVGLLVAALSLTASPGGGQAIGAGRHEVAGPGGGGHV